MLIYWEFLSYNLETISPIIGISNYQFEISKNEGKRQIDVLDKRYVSMFLQDLRRSLSYFSKLAEE